MAISLLLFQIRELVPESQMYVDLLTFEKKLDYNIMRKRLDIQEALKRPVKVDGERESVWVRIFLFFVEEMQATNIYHPSILFGPRRC